MDNGGPFVPEPTGNNRKGREVISKEGGIIPWCTWPMMMLLLTAYGPVSGCPQKQNGNLLHAAVWMESDSVGARNSGLNRNTWPTLFKAREKYFAGELELNIRIKGT